MRRIIAAMVLALPFTVNGMGGAVQAQERLTPAIWVDPDGCEHWVIDDGAEGYMTPHLRRDGTPVCRSVGACAVFEADVLFATNSNIVTNQGRARLSELFDRTRSRGYIITGHTDSRGTDEFNMRLAQRRASAVARVAQDLGAPVTDVVAYGERQPRADNSTAAGRRINRRVEVLCLS